MRNPALGGGTRRWLLLIHQLPATPSNLRVRTWRRLQQLGALPLKQAAYVLPDSAEAREDFEWLRSEIVSAGGEATVLVADHADAWADDELIEQFRRARQEAYLSLAEQLRQAIERLGRRRQPRGGPMPGARQLLERFRPRQAAIDRIDFFGSAGRDRVADLLRQLEARAGIRGASRPGPAPTGGPYHARQWVTRPRPGVDRMASAWLIRRFIDPAARFGFAPDRESVPDGAVPFDMFGVEFTHRDDGCTFETLCATFALSEPAVARIAAIVHDLDLHDERYGAAEAATVGALVQGLQLAVEDDPDLLSQGMMLFESLYRTFERHSRPTAPRPVARPRRRGPRR